MCVLDSATQARTLLGSPVPSLPHSPTRQIRSVSPSVNIKLCVRPLELAASFQSLLEANDEDVLLARNWEGGGEGEHQKGDAGGWELACMDADLYCAVGRPASHPGIDMDRGAFLHVWVTTAGAYIHAYCMHEREPMRGGGEGRGRDRES